MELSQISIVYHFGLVLAVLWILSSFSYCHPVAYFICFIYLFEVNERYILKLRKRLHHEEKKQAHQKRLLSDSETVRWLNHLLEKVWPICMEQIASQKILFPIIPWFLEKYKPWTARKAVVQELYLGRNPPMVTEMRVLGQSADDDHLVLELGLNFLSADDMSAILAVQLRKRLGFGMWTKLHVTGMHIEGKVLVGVKFLRTWPFLQRVRLCFVQPPYFQMTVKPIFSHGLDVTEIPGVAGWLDNLLAVAFGETLVEPNMLVLDVDKLVRSAESSYSEESWFFVDEKRSIAHAKVEIVEAADMKPSDPNGLADPYVKGHLGPYRFRTKVQRKTLAPKWKEEFKIPISTWDSPNVLEIEVRDKDLFLDDMLGECSININDLRGGQRHDKWLPLLNVKMGRLHIAITIVEVDPNAKDIDNTNVQARTKNGDWNLPVKDMVGEELDRFTTDKNRDRVTDKFEPINIEGKNDTGIWVHQPGTDVSATWEPRKGRNRNPETIIQREVCEDPDSPVSVESPRTTSSSKEERMGKKDQKPIDTLRRGFRIMGLVLPRRHKGDMEKSDGQVPPTPRPNLKALGDRGRCVTLVLDDAPEDIKEQLADSEASKDCPGLQKCETSSPGKDSAKNVAKSILKHARKSAHCMKHRLRRKGSSKNQDGSDKSSSTDDISATSRDEFSQEAVDSYEDSAATVAQRSLSSSSRDPDSPPAQTPRHLPEIVVNSPVPVGSCGASNEIDGDASASRITCDRENGVRDTSRQSLENKLNLDVRDSQIGSPRT